MTCRATIAPPPSGTEFLLTRTDRPRYRVGMIKSITISTPREGFIPVTARVREAVAESGIGDGLCVVFCPHTTAGVTINENADPDVVRDLLLGLETACPDNPRFLHREGNSSAHLKASIIGSSVTVIVAEGVPVLGTWQGIYLCEFDGPRQRTIVIKTFGTGSITDEEDAHAYYAHLQRCSR